MFIFVNYIIYIIKININKYILISSLKSSYIKTKQKINYKRNKEIIYITFSLS